MPPYGGEQVSSSLRIRTGRAAPQMLDHVQVEAYGAVMPLNQVAQVSVPEPTQLLIKPFDKSQLRAIEKGITISDLGMAPQNDGNVIRLNVPPLSEERRKQLASQAKDSCEKCKVAMRNSRRDAIKQKASAITQFEKLIMRESAPVVTRGDHASETSSTARWVKNANATILTIPVPSGDPGSIVGVRLRDQLWLRASGTVS